MSQRYFVESPIEGPTVRLTGSEAHHLAHVMRARAGDDVVLFDGGGAEYAARVEHIARAEIGLAVLERRDVDREPAVHLTLGVALPKPDRARWLVEKATELGVARLVPLVTQFAGQRPAPATLVKLRRAVIEACKQCGRNRLMEIAEPQPFDAWIGTVEGARLLAHPASADPRSTTSPPLSHPGPLTIAVGPEGGFSPQEVERALAAGWRTVALGERILRVETAALALAALCLLPGGRALP
ncbi:MAG: 16S rRNA (uracil(1498)-N(3))-methyltransferase [Planctomycetota bacterium]|nr:MAG: 16S rRNA (uracil(1498)-N(3))-methyltransferase [Planctomycetota bacterium]